MGNESNKIVLTLLLINKGEPLNNSFKLTRILEWKFKEIGSKKILDKIKEKKYVEYELANGVHLYKITDLGKEFIKQWYAVSLEDLLKEYPSESEFITVLFNSVQG